MAGKTKGAQTTHTAERWQRIVRFMDETFDDYLAGMTALRQHVVMDLKRKLSDSHVLDGPHQDQPSPRERPASAARHRRARGRRTRG